MNRRIRRRVSMVRPYKGRPPRKFIGIRVWPHDTLRVGESYELTDPRKFQSARNSAYQFGQRFGRRFECVRFVRRGQYTLRVERVK